MITRHWAAHWQLRGAGPGFDCYTPPTPPFSECTLFPSFLSSSPPNSAQEIQQHIVVCCLPLLCLASSLLPAAGAGGIVVLVCVPRSVLSAWQFSASRQGGKSILSDLWRCPLCNNTAQRRAGSCTWHIPSRPPRPSPGSPFHSYSDPFIFPTRPSVLL